MIISKSYFWKLQVLVIQASQGKSQRRSQDGFCYHSLHQDDGDTHKTLISAKPDQFTIARENTMVVTTFAAPNSTPWKSRFLTYFATQLSKSDGVTPVQTTIQGMSRHDDISLRQQAPAVSSNSMRPLILPRAAAISKRKAEAEVQHHKNLTGECLKKMR